MQYLNINKHYYALSSPVIYHTETEQDKHNATESTPLPEYPKSVQLIRVISELSTEGDHRKKDPEQ